MNRIYKIVRSRKNGQAVVTSEMAKGNKKSLTGKVQALTAGILTLSALSASAADITINVDQPTQSITVQTVVPTGDTLIINFDDPGNTLTFEDITATSNGGAISITAPDPDGTSPLTFTDTGGHLIFSNNSTSSQSGGAVFSSRSNHFLLDFTGLTTITFNNNIAGNASYGDGGGIYSYSVTLGDNATFSGNIAGNAGDGYGGGIYSYSVTLGDNATFSGNIAGNASSGNGGGISSSYVTLGNDATFSGNIAGNASGGNGGGISSVSVTLGDNATFSGNIAGNADDGNGGGIYSSSVELGQGAYFTQNRAGGKNGGGSGGAIYSRIGITLAGNSFFSGNLVSQGGTASLGGAIYLHGTDGPSLGSTATLNADVGDIAFKGNYVNVDTSDINNIDLTGAIANAIHLARETKLDLNGSHNIYFDDAISSGTDGNNSLVKQGAGLVQFIGDNRLNTTGFTSANSVDIQEGTFRLAKKDDGSDSTFDAGGGGAFNLNSGATIAGSGEIMAGSDGFTISGILSPDGNRFDVPTYDPDTHTFASTPTTIDDSVTGTLTLTGNAILDGATLQLDTTSTSADKIAFTGTVELKNGTDTAVEVTNHGDNSQSATIDAAGGISGTGSLTKTGNGSLTLSNANSYSGGTTIDAGTLALQGAGTIADSSSVTLNGSGIFDISQTTSGVIVNNLSGSQNSKVNLGSQALTVNDIRTNGNTFSGVIDGAGSLIKTGTGELTLTNTNTYSGGTTIDAGTLVAGVDGALGNSDITVNQNGTLTLNYDNFANNLTGNGRLTVDLASKTNDFTFDDGKTFTGFSGTVDIQKGNINLNHTANNDALQQADLSLGANGQATVTGNTNLANTNFTFNGGTLKLDMDTSNNEKLTVKDIDASGNGTVKVDVIGAMDTTISSENWYDYHSSKNAKQQQLVSAKGSVTGGGQLTVTDLTGASITGEQSVAIGSEGMAIFDHIATVLQDGDDAGLYLGYTLTQLQANANQSITLDSTAAKSSDVTISAQLTGDGGFTFNGSKGATIANSTNNYSGVSKVDGTSLTLGSDNAFGKTSELTLVNGATVNMNGKSQTVGDLVSADTASSIHLGTLTVNQTDSSTSSSFAGKLTGAGSLIKDGAGTLTLTNGNNDYAGSTTINHGTLTATNNGALGLGNIAINGGALHLNFTGDFNNTLTGAGNLTTNSQGTIIVLGNNSGYTGNTSITGGELVAGHINALGSGSVDIAGNTSLTLKANGTLSNTLTGGGAFNINDQSIEYIGSSSSFAGTTTVDGGKLSLNGDLGGALNVSNGTFAGNGSFSGNVNINRGGILSPGNSIGSLTVNGNIAFDSGAYFDIEVDPTNSSNGDKVVVNGTATLGGATVRHIGQGTEIDYSLDGTEWTILSADTIEGSFAEAVETAYAMLMAKLVYGNDGALDTVALQLTRIANFDSFARTYNQHSVAAALDSLQGSGSVVYNKITNIMGDGDDVRAAYDSLSGEVHAGVHSALMNADRRFASMMSERLSSGVFKQSMNNEVVANQLDSTHYFWLTADGHRTETDKTHGNAKSVFTTGGLTLGSEVERDKLTYGGALHYGDSDYKLDSRQSKADITSFNFAGYGAYQLDEWRFKAGASYGWHQIDSSRYVSLTNERVKGDYDIHTVQLFGEVAQNISLNSITLEPYIGMGWNLSHSESFTETGGAAGLHSESKNNHNLNTTAGSRLFYQPANNVTLGADLNWQHTYGKRHSKSEFTFTGSDSFSIQGMPIDRDSLGVKLEAGVQLNPAVSLKAAYQGRFGNNSKSNGGFASVEIRF